MNLVEYAKHIHRSKQQVHQWIQPGKLLERAAKKIGRRIEINAELADAILETSLNITQTRRNQIKAEGYNFQDALTKDKYYAAALKKVKLDREQGLLTLKSEEEKEAFDCARMTRDGVLNVVDRVAPILAAMTDEFEIGRLLNKELTQALENLAK